MGNTENAKMGMNRTGVQMSPYDTRKQMDYAKEHSPDVPGSDQALARRRHARISMADSVGSVPIPGSARGAMKTTFEKVKGKNPEVLIDKLGERLAFERSGVRLYEALLTKAEACGESQETLEKLRHFRDEEAKHMGHVIEAMEQLGADPTAQTPCADVAGVSALGVLQVITDPMTNMAQSLDALLTAELTDNAAWELLIELAREAGQEDMVPNFEQALRQEQNHLTTIKSWLKTGLTEQLQ